MKIFVRTTAIRTYRMKKESRKLFRKCPRTKQITEEKPAPVTGFCDRLFFGNWLRSRTRSERFPRFFFYCIGTYCRRPYEYFHIFIYLITGAIYDLRNPRSCDRGNTSVRSESSSSLIGSKVSSAPSLSSASSSARCCAVAMAF